MPRAFRVGVKLPRRPGSSPERLRRFDPPSRGGFAPNNRFGFPKVFINPLAVRDKIAKVRAELAGARATEP